MAPGPPPVSRGPSIQLCDGCCCGTSRKHPGVDHDAIRRRLTAAAEAAGGRARVVGCLDQCAHSNVVTVRVPGRSRLWLGRVLDEPAVGAVERWLRQGALLPVPPAVSSLLVRPEQGAEAMVELGATASISRTA